MGGIAAYRISSSELTCWLSIHNHEEEDLAIQGKEEEKEGKEKEKDIPCNHIPRILLLMI
jgi:hypothetical protein